MSLFSKFFNKKEVLSGFSDFSSLNTDIHSHLIPGIDDGSKSMEDSIALILKMQELGFKKLITTPHIMSDHFKNTPEIIKAGLEKLRQELERLHINIEIDAAAEYYLDEEFEKKVKKGDILTFGDKYVLFEISYVNPPSNLKETIFLLQSSGYKPVLAHPERYPFWYDHFEKYKEIKDVGVYFMVNTNSFSGYYGKGAQMIAEKLANEKMVDFCGSDTHHLRHIASLSKGLENKILQKLLHSDLLLNPTV